MNLGWGGPAAMVSADTVCKRMQRGTIDRVFKEGARHVLDESETPHRREQRA